MASAALAGAGERIVVALDRDSTEGNLALIQALRGHARWFKVGMREFYASGDRVCDAVRSAGARLFLDLKLHDIPETVRGAVQSLSRLAPDLLTVHAAGGSAMVEAAVDAAPAATRIVAVTVLTSLDGADLDAMGVAGDVAGAASRWGVVALKARAHGLVCSAHEAASLRREHPTALLVTPGIRPAGTAHGDQKRVQTRSAALVAGASLLVIGRPIAHAASPLGAFQSIVDEAQAAHASAVGAASE